MNEFVFYLFTYPVGIVIGAIFWLLRHVGAIKVKGWKNFPHGQTRVIVVSNHPYKGEQWLQVGLFFPMYIPWPHMFGPWNLVAKENYTDRYPFLKPRFITIDRGKKDDGSGLELADKVLEAGESLIIYPEAGRTAKGKEHVFSRTGKRIRLPFKRSFAHLARKPGRVVVPVWWEFGSKFRFPTTVVIGEPMIFNENQHPKEITALTIQALLVLADQAS